ncbi:hypothetical protein GobsT_12930 [Gemmata obscuriglobus]|uniref:DUF1501 domain-containing protein n=1 Tax=Gemmata obscuriglobus TaxID=114 RepID=A0A2Z3HFS5_9BACT|nr:DUF1501 domain-containing protein [Gemmata obscuriglobus]AWM40250.1 DUF1501 domain-containing protein [Gemmata obscuriglobus]QEG26552.1 hypothetical protein GobsT_12930 [Gemmata obscuriglobus]VTS01943.1 Uncharacterized protein OS=Singulisphaera acidiphila (strain ATCC BAA-1392 / DSM 18658 / VKM B-2454 / MOB10) GN=Sinac_7201 PE=4 SV=1: DUF1501 [Gemmata obscuriglobus UQM 2246]
MHTRRSFLQSSAVLALAPTVPLFVSRSLASAPADRDARVLVVVELDGGNDALNTVVPLADETYARLRPKLKHDPKRLRKLTDSIGLHPALKPLDKLLDAGRLAVLPGVGYPNPNRSHFESMARWHTASLDPEELTGYGWLGRALDPSGGSLFAVGGEVSPALRGRRSSAVAFKRLEELHLADAAARQGVGRDTSEDLLGFVRRQAVDAHTAADKLARLASTTSGPSYPQSELANRLQLTARLMKSGVGARVFYTQQSGYDTHSQQQFTHANLLSEFAEAVAAFFADLSESKLADRVALLAFSEFGRTIKENGSVGTDHGTAGACFVAAPNVKAPVAGAMPNLTDLDGGEPKMTTDFRAVYAALLRDWLGLGERLGQGIAPVSLGAW